jgi:hypothetical protein
MQPRLATRQWRLIGCRPTESDMGLMDKVKAQATQLAQKTQDTARDSKVKFDQAQAKRQGDVMLRNLGAAVYADRTGRGTAETAAEIDRLVTEISSHEAENEISLAQEPTAAPSGVASAEPSTWYPSSPPAPPAEFSAAPAPPAGFPPASEPSTGFPPASEPSTGFPPASEPSAGFPPAPEPASAPSTGFPPAPAPEPAPEPSAGIPPAPEPAPAPPAEAFPPAAPTGFPPEAG